MSQDHPARNKSESDTILENLLDAVLVIDLNGKIIYANKSAENLFEKSIDKLRGENFGFPVTPFEIQEIQIVNNKEVRSVQMLATTIAWMEKEAFLTALRDITEKEKLEDQLLKAFRELIVADEQLKKLNSELEQKVAERTIELEKKNSDLNAYAEHLKKAYEETETKVKFRNLEQEKTINLLYDEIKRLKSKSN